MGDHKTFSIGLGKKPMRPVENLNPPKTSKVWTGDEKEAAKLKWLVQEVEEVTAKISNALAMNKCNPEIYQKLLYLIEKRNSLWAHYRRSDLRNTEIGHKALSAFSKATRLIDNQRGNIVRKSFEKFHIDELPRIKFGPLEHLNTDGLRGMIKASKKPHFK